jgi:hypothetical protein
MKRAAVSNGSAGTEIAWAVELERTGQVPLTVRGVRPLDEIACDLVSAARRSMAPTISQISQLVISN